MNRKLVIVESPDRNQVILDLLSVVNPLLLDNWWIVGGTLVEFVAPRRGGYRYAWAVELEQEASEPS